jgi:hypothetical protein
VYLSSERFDTSLRESHDVEMVCNVMDETQTNVLATLDIVAGHTQLDGGQSTRGSCQLTLQDPTGLLVPNVADDLLQPYSGFTLQLERGIRWRDGTTETFPLGTFWPYNPQVNDSGDQLQIQVDGYDTSKIISRIRWTQPFVLDAGTNTGDAIKQVLDDRMPGLRYNIEPTGHTIPLTTLGADPNNNDPWADVSALASSDGLEVFFDAGNVLTVRRTPDPDVNPVVATYDDGVNSIVTEFDRQNNGDVIYTGVIVTSEGSGVPVPIRSERWRPDTDLRIPYFYTTSLITTQEQADAVAASLMTQVTRAEFGVVVHAVPDPRQELGDVVRIVRERSKIDDVFSIVQLTMPLDEATAMTFQTSQRRTPG